MTELATRLGWPERHRSVGKWPRIGHLNGHVEDRWSRWPATQGEQLALLPLLLEPHGIPAIAATMGSGYSVRWIENRALLLTNAFGLTGTLTHRRLALVALAAGVHPCFCE